MTSHKSLSWKFKHIWERIKKGIRKCALFLLKLQHCSLYFKKKKNKAWFYTNFWELQVMWKNITKILKGIFSNPATVKLAFLLGWYPCSSPVHHHLFNRVVKQSLKGKKTHNTKNLTEWGWTTAPASLLRQPPQWHATKGRKNRDCRAAHRVHLSTNATHKKFKKWHSLTEAKPVPHVPFKAMSVENPSHWRMHLPPPKKNNASEKNPFSSKYTHL